MHMIRVLVILALSVVNGDIFGNIFRFFVCKLFFSSFFLWRQNKKKTN